MQSVPFAGMCIWVLVSSSVICLFSWWVISSIHKTSEISTCMHCYMFSLWCSCLNDVREHFLICMASW